MGVTENSIFLRRKKNCMSIIQSIILLVNSEVTHQMHNVLLCSERIKYQGGGEYCPTCYYTVCWPCFYKGFGLAVGDKNTCPTCHTPMFEIGDRFGRRLRDNRLNSAIERQEQLKKSKKPDNMQKPSKKSKKPKQ